MFKYAVIIGGCYRLMDSATEAAERLLWMEKMTGLKGTIQTIKVG